MERDRAQQGASNEQQKEEKRERKREEGIRRRERNRERKKREQHGAQAPLQSKPGALYVRRNGRAGSIGG